MTQHQPRAGRVEDGTWNYMRISRHWHFDPLRAGVEHRLVAKVVSGLDQIRERLPKPSPKFLRNSMEHRAEDSYFSRIQAGNARDADTFGFSVDAPYAEVFDSKNAAADSAEDVIGMEDLLRQLPLAESYWKFHRQNPGSVWPIHFDNYHAFEPDPQEAEAWQDPGVRRLMIALGDWQWGQFFQFGNSAWSHWEAGDVVAFDWLVPHGSANCGHSPRETLVVTGRIAEGFDAWASGDVVHELRC